MWVGGKTVGGRTVGDMSQDDRVFRVFLKNIQAQHAFPFGEVLRGRNIWRQDGWRQDDWSQEAG